MPFLDVGRYTCIICNVEHKQRMVSRDFVNPIRCRGCKGWICPTCQSTKSKMKENICPKCGGELYAPLFGI